MTDMHATERLLEVIEERAASLDDLTDNYSDWVYPILEAIRELRRRGDTLVRRDDLMLAVGMLVHQKIWDDVHVKGDIVGRFNGALATPHGCVPRGTCATESATLPPDQPTPRTESGAS